MPGSSREKSAETAPSRRGRIRWRLLGLAAAFALVAGLGVAVWRPGQPQRSAAFDHGLGLNPTDGALYVAAHDGLYRVPVTVDPVRMAGRVQDFTGFTVTGPDRVLASGHPAPDSDGPPSVGLIESTDAGLTWVTSALPREADFHRLDASDGTVYGYNAMTGTVMASSDGQVWTSTPLAGVADLAVDPENPRQVLATTAQGVARSRDRGRTFAVRGQA